MNLSKPPKVKMPGAVKQMRGPGMNLGLKKPRPSKAVKPYHQPKAMKDALAGGSTNSYLPTLAGGGKVISCKQS